MIIEGRTVTTLAELRDFVDAAVGLTKDVNPVAVRLTAPLDLRVCLVEGLSLAPSYEIEAR